jgi:hypothetical protein
MGHGSVLYRNQGQTFVVQSSGVAVRPRSSGRAVIP